MATTKMKKATRGMRWPGKGMSWKEFAAALKKEWNSDTMGDTAGNLTFAGIMALFPFLMFLVALGSVFLTPQNTDQIVQMLGKFAPAEVTKIIQDRLHSLQTGNHFAVAAGSALVAFWSASGGITALMRALNTCYGVTERRGFLKLRGTAVLITLFTAVMSLLAALIAVAIPAIAHLLPSPFGGIFVWVRFPIAAALIMFMWAVLYYFLPDTEMQFRFITPGSVIGVAIWLVASYGFSVYVSHFGSYDKTYGTIGGVVVMLMWMWISAQVLLLGAEINAVIEHKSPAGKKAGARTMGQTGVDDTKTEKAEKVVGRGNPAFARVAKGDVGQLPNCPPRHPRGELEKTGTKIWAAFAALSYLFQRRREA